MYLFIFVTFQIKQILICSHAEFMKAQFIVTFISKVHNLLKCTKFETCAILHRFDFFTFPTVVTASKDK